MGQGIRVFNEAGHPYAGQLDAPAVWTPGTGNFGVALAAARGEGNTRGPLPGTARVPKPRRPAAQDARAPVAGKKRGAEGGGADDAAEGGAAAGGGRKRRALAAAAAPAAAPAAQPQLSGAQSAALAAGRAKRREKHEARVAKGGEIKQLRALAERARNRGDEGCAQELEEQAGRM